MRILVTGGTGTVGSAVVRALAGKGADLAVLTRDASKAAALPPGVAAVIGDLGTPPTVERVFESADAVFLISAVTPTEAHEGLMAVSGMRRARVRRVVYLSVQDADRAAWLPHFGAKAGVEQALRASGLDYTILRPNNFHQNDFFFKDAILQHGVYPQPLGSKGVTRIDVRDIAEAAATALLEGGHEGKTYELAGPDAVTGESTARSWSRALGREVRYAGDDVEAWAQQSRAYMPDWLVYDFREMYRYFQEHGLKGSDDAVEQTTRLLGHAPRSFDAFADETAAAWKG